MKQIQHILLIIIALLPVSLKAAPPDWSVNPSMFAYNMTITGAINIYYTPSEDADDMIAAFVGDECRGVAQPVYKPAVGRYICYLMVYSNAASETLTFKVYDASGDEIRDIEKTITFEVNGIIGNLEAPYIWSNPTLSSEAYILTYNIPNELRQTVEGYNITVEMPYGTDFTNLVADYTTSHLALVKVNNEVQETGITANNFSSPLNYWVRSADETVVNNYTIEAIVGNSFPTDISITSDSIIELMKIGTQVGILQTADIDPDTHTYTLVSGEGDTDNSAFTISGDTLKNAIRFDFETKNLYSIRVKSDDNFGGYFEKQLNVRILDYFENITLTSDSINELKRIGSPVGRFLYSDTINHGHIFTLVSGDGDTDNSAFTISGDTLKNAIRFDFETKNLYSIRVKSDDNFGGYFEKLLNVRIIDYFEDINISNDTVSENLNIDSLVTFFSNTDTLNIPHTYTLVAGEGDTDNAFFKINADSLINRYDIDYETKTSYSIRVEVNDSLGWTFQKSFTINVVDENDEIPQAVADTTIFIDENISNQAVYTIIASDADFSPEFRVLTYAQIDTLTDANFSVNPVSGVVSILNPLDYERKNEFPLYILISDNLNVTPIKITVKLNDLNDEIPVLRDTTLTVKDNLETETELVQFAATDRDADSELTYTLSDDFNGTFELTADGLLILKNYFDADIKNIYEFSVIVNDGVNQTQNSVIINVEYVSKINLVAHKIISPNADNICDAWEIDEPHIYRDCDFKIFNTSGEVIFDQKGYSTKWDGTYNGRELPIGAYYFLMTTPRGEHVTGSITLIK